MEIRVLFFATLKDVAGMARLDMEWSDGENVAGLKQRLAQRIPALEAALLTAVVSVNQEYAEDEVSIPAGAEGAVFPPGSGGSESVVCRISQNVLDLNAILAQITLPTTGAVCFFVGTVRAKTLHPPSPQQPTETDYLEYEAYTPMAEAKMKEIAAEIRQRWTDVEGVAIYQRVGRLEAGETAAVVACSASHRQNGAFEAARYGIERLKQVVPVWKKEVGPDGSVWVEGEHPAKEA